MSKVVVMLVLIGAWVSGACAAESFPGVINTGDVHIRADATVGAISICQAKEGQAVEVVDAAYDWYQITLPDQAPVFVFAKFVKRDADNEWVISGSNVNLRMQPDLGAPILGQVDKGTKVQVITESGEWYRIKPLPSTRGWIHKKFVDRATEPPLQSAVSLKSAQPLPPEARTKPQDAESKKGQQYPVISVQGVLRSKFFTAVATHKLIASGGKEVYLIRSSTVYLNDYVNEEVRVEGRVTEIPEAADPLIEVEKITREITD